MGSLEFAVLAARRATQLSRGCTPRVTGWHTIAVCAQKEFAEGKVLPLGAGTGWPEQAGGPATGRQR